jgi:hypothetical protein
MKVSTTILLLLITNICIAQNSLPVKKISIFKNNTAMVVKEGTAPVTAGKVYIPIPGHTIYGTFFLGTPKDNPIKNMAIVNDTLKKKEKAIAVWQLIAGNVGKAATISFAPGQKADKSISGRILSYYLQTGLIQVKEDNGKVACIHSTDLYEVEFSEESNNFYLADSIQRSLVFSPQNAGENIPLEEVYMQTGINWMPSYFLKLKDDKTARIEMKATIENFAEGLNDAETELIVGAPQMTNSGKPDPITYDYQTVEYAVPAATPYMYSNSNVMQTRGNYYAADKDAASGAAFESAFSTEGEKNGDMYIYKIGKITIGKNSKAIYPIFAGNIEYKDKYEGTIYDKTNYAYKRAADNEETPFDVYHSIEIKNSASVPLTTAPITIINEKEQFLAQDQLNYTPVGAPSTVRLSKAVDIIMKNAEEESTRTDHAKRVGGQVYSSIKLKGKITIENFQNKEVTVCATKEMSGKVSVASDNGKIIKSKSEAGLNPYTKIKWDVKLAPNEKKTVTYEYEVFFTPND